MNETSYAARVWSIEPRKNKQGKVTSYRVRWEVAGSPFGSSFKNKAQADSFRAELLGSARKGEAFSIRGGLPISMVRVEDELSWFTFAKAYVDMKWPDLSANSRKGVAGTLTTVTPAMLATQRGKPSDKILREALQGWAFNKTRRDSVAQPQRVRSALRWLEEHTLTVSTLGKPECLREAVRLITTKLDGAPAAASVVSRKRAVLHNALDYAVERSLLSSNPLPGLKWTRPKTVRAIDKRTVINPNQAALLLKAVGEQQPSGPRLEAFFAVMYYSAARPGEAVNLRSTDLLLPDESGDGQEWGEILLWETAPEAGARWSETGRRRDRRQLKHRARGETRPVPCPPQLVTILREHMRRFPPLTSGLVFYGVQGQQLSQSTYSHVWKKAREEALGEVGAASPLARRPYDLRHATVSTWLNAGVPPTQVAEWAGHSVAVLLQIYAKTLAGQEEMARGRVQQALAGG